jgi:hypothetical protein
VTPTEAAGLREENGVTARNKEKGRVKLEPGEFISLGNVTVIVPVRRFYFYFLWYSELGLSEGA